jgi:hypothetical protein
MAKLKACSLAVLEVCGSNLSKVSHELSLFRNQSAEIEDCQPYLIMTWNWHLWRPLLYLVLLPAEPRTSASNLSNTTSAQEKVIN